MAYGTVKVDNITFDNGGSDQNVTVSGLYNSLTSGITVTGTISGAVVIGSTSVSGTTVAGVTVTGTTVQGASGTFTSLTGTTIQGTTATFTSGIIASGTAAAPSLAILGDLNTGIFSPGADQVAVVTNGVGRLFVDSSGNVAIAQAPSNTASFTRSFNISALDASIALRGSSGGTYTDQGIFFAVDGVNYSQIYNDGIGQLIFRTGSGLSERLRIDSAGLVGIGDSAPSTNLVIRGSGASIANVNTHFLVSDSTTATAGVGGSISFEGNYTSGGARAAWAAIAGTKENATDGNYAGSLKFYTRPNGNSSQLAMTIDSSQRVGIGTTSPVATLHVENTAGGDLFYALGSSSDVFKISSDSSTINLDTRNTTGGLAFQIQGTEKARIDSSGRLLVGTSSARETSSGNDPFVQFERSSGSALVLSATKNGADAFGPYFALIKSRGTSAGANNLVSSGDEIGSIFFYGTDGTNPETGAAIQAYVDGTPGANDMPGRLVFSTTADGASSPTERMRIGQSGYMKLSNNGSYLGTAATYHEIIGNAGSGSLALSVANTSATGNGVQINSNSDGTSYVYLIGYSTSAAANRIIIWSNGNVVNTNNSYGAISDIKLKENIVDANSQWDDLKALQVRNYNFKEGQTHTQIGLVAQEVELVSPGLVTESPDRDEDGNDLGTVTKSVNYSVLYMKAVKALQEAMERIESLEQRLNDAGIN
jgi:hypothetical protein